MKKRIWILSILLACLTFVLCACTDNTVTAKLRKTSAELKVGETVKLVVDVSDPEAEISWAVSDGTVLEIVESTLTSATVKALKSGSASVYVMYEEDTLAQCDITVPEVATDELTVLVPTGKLILRSSNREATVRAIAGPDLTGEVTWTVSDDTVVKVENQGLIARIRSLKPGRATVTVSCGGKNASFEVIVGLYS